PDARPSGRPLRGDGGVQPACGRASGRVRPEGSGAAMSESVLDVTDLQVSFTASGDTVPAVRGVSFALHKGEVLAVVGESGSGKSVTAPAIVGLLAGNGRIDAGAIRFRGRDLTTWSERELRRIRGNEISMIFQDPMTCLDPTMTIGNQVIEPLRQHTDITRRQ